MLAFCGYNMSDYFAHWVQMGAAAGANAPKIYCVNWFRKDENGKFIWPGFGENMRVLKWIVERVEGKAPAQQTAIGHIPAFPDLDWQGLSFSPEMYAQITAVSSSQWRQELALHDELLNKLHDRLPAAMSSRYQALKLAI
jgi:phosphoenolpyruvate carboxykinase (GTP)